MHKVIKQNRKITIIAEEGVDPLKENGNIIWVNEKDRIAECVDCIDSIEIFRKEETGKISYIRLDYDEVQAIKKAFDESAKKRSQSFID